MLGRALRVKRAALSLVVISLVAAGCGGSESSQTKGSSETSETVDSAYGTTPVSEATAAWRTSIKENFTATLVEASCARSLAEDLKTIDPNYFECGADLKSSSGSVFTEYGSVMCKPKCIVHIGEGAGAYGP